MSRMRTLLIAALAAVAAPAAAQTLDPLAAHRLQMEQIRARTELQGLTATVHAAQTGLARQQLQATVRRDPIVAASPPSDYVPASSPRCDPRTVSAKTPCVVERTPPRRK